MIRALTVMLLLLLSAPVWAADWEEKWFNPKPSSGDLILPLPCGGAMAFRPVDVPEAGGALDDDTLPLGDPTTSRGYSDYQRTAFLSAPFRGEQNGRRYFIGKYDVTQDQFAALTSGTCPTPSPGGRLPKTRISWIQAMDFAFNWSGWLLAHARDKLPRHGESYAYLRLPTEDEWEYAARGGIKVSPEQFLGSTFPAPDGIQAYVWAGPATGGKPGQVGSKKPNPLDLYDMLGNVEQMMLEPYRLNRVGRLHGMAGGIVTRGGDYSTSPADLSTSLRGELPPLNPATDEPTVLATLGFRLVLSAPVGTGTQADIQQLAAAFEQLSKQREGIGADPRKLVAELKNTTSDDALRRGLDNLDATLAGANRERGDAARNALLAQLEAAAAMAFIVESRERYAGILEAMAEEQTTAATMLQGRGIDPAPFVDLETADTWRKLAPTERAEADAALDGYFRLLRQIANGPARDDVAAQGDVLRQELMGRNQRRVLAFLPVTLRDLEQLTTGKSLDRMRVHDEIIAAGRSAR